MRWLAQLCDPTTGVVKPSVSCVSISKWRQMSGRASGSMRSTSSPSWKMRHGAGGLADRHGDSVGLLADGRRRPVPGAQAFAERDTLGQHVQVHASSNRHAVPANDQCPFELGNVLDLLADLAVADVSLGVRCSPGTG